MRNNLFVIALFLTTVLYGQSDKAPLTYSIDKNDPYALKNLSIGIIPVNVETARDAYVTLSPNFTFDYRKDSTFLLDADLKIGVFDNVMAMKLEDNIHTNIISQGGEKGNFPLIRFDAGGSYIFARKSKIVKKRLTLSSHLSANGNTTTVYTRVNYKRQALYGVYGGLGYFHSRANFRELTELDDGDSYSSNSVPELSYNDWLGGKARSSLNYMYAKIGITQLLLHDAKFTVSEYGKRSIDRSFKAHFNLLVGFANSIEDYKVTYEERDYDSYFDDDAMIERTNVFHIDNSEFTPIGFEFGFIENGLGYQNNVSFFFNGGFRPGYYGFSGNGFAEGGILIVLSKKADFL